MILWQDLVVERPSCPVPSIHHQTLLSKTIFEHCLDYSQVASIALASKSIQNSSLSPNFASNIIIDDNAEKLFETVFHPSTSLPLQFVPQLKSVDCLHLLHQLVCSTKYFTKSLRSLSFEGCILSDVLRACCLEHENPNDSHDFDEFYDQQFATFTALESLELECCKTTETDVEKINGLRIFPILQNISVEDCDEDSASAVTKLIHLKSFVGFDTDTLLTELSTAQDTVTIQKLVLFCRYGFPADASLSKLGLFHEHLTTLKVNCAQNTSWKGLKHLTLLQNLTSLNLNNSVRNVGDIHWDALLSSFPKLTELSLASCAITDKAFAPISRMPRLTLLNLASCALPSDADADSLIQQYLPPLAPTLTDLDLTGIKIQGLDSIALLTNLRRAMLHGCKNVITGKPLPLFHSITKLESDVSPELLAGINASFPNLKQLGIGGPLDPNRITNSGLEQIVTLQFLDHLDLQNCDSITNQGLKLVFSRLLWLTKLEILRCGDGVTDEIFHECIDDIRLRLSYLDISLSKKITAKTADMLAANCPRVYLVNYGRG